MDLSVPQGSASDVAYARAARVLPRGVSSVMRLGYGQGPLIASSADRVRVTDPDGREYLDFALGNGPLALGHTPLAVLDAIRQELARGLRTGMTNEGEAELGESLVESFPSAERVCFLSSGSEAVHLALRIARAATGRRLVVKMEGHYHGWVDDVAWSVAGSPPAGGDALAPLVPTRVTAGLRESPDLLVVRCNVGADLERAFELHGSEIAAVILEPVPLVGVIEPDPAYLRLLRSLTEQHGSVLIFDEVLTGFRVAVGGAQTRLGVTPDMTTLGKALGAGMPIAAVVGKEGPMAVVASGQVPHQGTYNGFPASIAAARAAVREYQAPGFQPRLDALSARLATGIETLAQELALPLVVHVCGGLLQVLWVPDGRLVRTYADVMATDVEFLAELATDLRDRGILVRARGTWLISSAHSEADIDQALEALALALRRLRCEGGA